MAAGSPGLVHGSAVQPGAVVIDCGINVLADGRIVGDVDLPSVLPVAGAVTPVPGGVGPVTNAVLMEHLARAARAQLGAACTGAPRTGHLSATMRSSLEIAQSITPRPITEIAEELGLLPDEIEPYGRYKAKVSLAVLDRLAGQPDGREVIVTAITPTPLGEGKTTTTIGLVQGLRRLGIRAAVAIRQPSLGPVFGIKGGGAGGGFSQVLPMEDINLHFTGDIHAISAAHDLAAAFLDNHLLRGNELGIDLATIRWPRVLDVNDRALRRVRIGARRGIGRADR